MGQRNKKPDAVKQGTWGGRSVGLEVTGGGARVEFDCAHGSINRKLTLDAAGRFEVEGTLVAERGGPVREGEQAEGQPARYSGRVEGASMTLTVTLTDTKETIGTFNLAHGKAPTLTKCL